MLTEISAGLGSLKALKEIIQALDAARNERITKEVKSRLLDLVLDAQDSQFAAQQARAADAKTIADLEQEIVRLKDWSGERERYELVEVDTGAFAYMAKPGMRGGEPAHWLCATCFSDGKKSILQRQDGQMRVPHKCNTCRGQIVVHSATTPVYRVDG